MNFRKYLPWLVLGGFLTYNWLEDLKTQITYRIVNLKIKDLSLQGVVLYFIWNVQNVSNTAFTVVETNGKILYQNIELSNFYIKQPVESLPNSSVEIPLSVAVKWIQPLAAAPVLIEAFQTKNIVLDFVGSYTVKIFGFTFNVPFHHTIPILQ